MNGVYVLPVDYFPGTTNPKNPALAEAVQEWCKAQFGKPVALHAMGKAWGAVRQTDDGFEVCGAVAIAHVIDCPLFHVTPSAEPEDTAQRDEARAVRDMLMQRASNYIQDYAGPETEVLVYVAPEKRKFWKGYLRMIGAKESNRFILKV